MAYRVIYQDPRDLDGRKAIGVKMPFYSDSVFESTYNSLEAYKVNLYNFFMTQKKERYFNPELGSSLMQYLFNPVLDQDTLSSIESTIRFDIKTYFPRLEIIQVNLDEYPDDNLLQIDIQFKVKGTELEDSLVLDINR